MHQRSDDWNDDLPNPWSSTRTVESHPYRDWLKAVFCWDGMLPFLILGTAASFRLLLPKQEGVQVAAAIFIPIAAFIWRAALADRHFGQGRQFGWQVLLFFLGIFFLVILDAVFIVSQMNPQPMKPEDWRALGTIYLIYLTVMAISLFPFRKGVIQNGSETETEFEIT